MSNPPIFSPQRLLAMEADKSNVGVTNSLKPSKPNMEIRFDAEAKPFPESVESQGGHSLDERN